MRDVAVVLRADFRRSATLHSTAVLARARELALEVHEIDEAWKRESGEFESEHGAAPLRVMSPCEEVEVDYARMAWKAASALAQELLD